MSLKYAFVIPHCFLGDAINRMHGSSRLGVRRLRSSVLDEVIFQIHNLFGQRHWTLDCATMNRVGGLNSFSVDFQIFVMTTGKSHLLSDLQTYPTHFEHIKTRVEPQFLGWECARWISNHLGEFDYFIYLEDDLIIRDQTFLKKVSYFNAISGQAVTNAVLQPQRYERALNTKDKRTLANIEKLYIDYAKSDDVIPEGPPLNVHFMDMEIELEVARNPHAGCYIVNSEQAERMCSHSDFLNPEKIYISPLDTAASAFLARTHTIYKTSIRNLSFFEVEHGHQTCLPTMSDPYH